MNQYEAGQKWKMRNGLVAEIRRVTGNGEAWANFTDADGVARHSNFLKSGAYLPSGKENELDLVELVTDTNLVQSKQWRAVPRAELECSGQRIIEDEKGDEVAYVGFDEDAEFIMLACNAHAGLVDALKKLAETNGSYDNVRNTEVLAARVRKVASDALTSAGVK